MLQAITNHRYGRFGFRTARVLRLSQTTGLSFEALSAVCIECTELGNKTDPKPPYWWFIESALNSLQSESLTAIQVLMCLDAYHGGTK